MKLSLRFLLLLIGFLPGKVLKAQSSFHLTINSVIDTFYYYGESIALEGSVTYNGPGIYQGELTLGYSAMNTGGSGTSGTVPGFLQSITLQNQESAGFSTVLPVSPSIFLQGGGHTVIVWPIVTPEPAGVDIDSVTFETIILDTTMAIHEWATVKQARVYPVPATDYLELERPGQAPVAKLTVYDIKGRTVYTGKATERFTRLPLDGWMPGTYVLRYSDGVKPDELHRFVKR